MLKWSPKDPDEVLDYSWTPAIDTGDTLSTATLSVIDGSVAIDSQDDSTGILVAFLSGGADGEIAEFLARATTTGGRTFEETIILPIRATTGSALANTLVDMFPAFASVTAGTVDTWLTIAARTVTSTFGDDEDYAKMLLACHLMTLQGIGTGEQAKLAQTGVSEMKSGTISLKFAEALAEMGEYGKTSYGRMLWPYLKAYMGGPRVMATGTYPVYPSLT